MPNSAYTTLPNIFGFCPTAVIPAAVPLQTTATTVTISGLSSSIPNPIAVGMGVLVNDEIMAVQSFTSTTVTLLRGCADTIPQAHPANSRIWFFQSSTGRLPTEYAASDSISVKPLVRTSSAVMTVAQSVPIGVAMNFRVARPYPPGNVQVNGQPWYSANPTVGIMTPLTITWAHRNRVTQADLLLSHTDGSVTPEVGQLYRIRVYTEALTLVATYTTSTDSFEYTAAQALSDAGIVGSSPTPLRIVLECLRGGYFARADYTINFTIEAQPVTITESYTVSYNFLQVVSRSQSISYNFTARPERALAVSYNFAVRPERTLTISYNFSA